MEFQPDLYNERIDAMKARERGDWCFGLSVMKQMRRNAARNIDRLAAYRRKYLLGPEVVKLIDRHNHDRA